MKEFERFRVSQLINYIREKPFLSLFGVTAA